MIIYNLSKLLALAGAILLILEIIFSISIFPYSGSIGFALLFIGTYIYYYKKTHKIKLSKKELGDLPYGGGYGGGDSG